MTPPHTTDPDDKLNRRVAVMAELGFFTSAICERTGLTQSQVNSRTSLYGIKRADYRRGHNEASQRVLKKNLFDRKDWTGMISDYENTRTTVRARLAKRRKAAAKKMGQRR